MARAYVSIGSNMRRRANVGSALRSLEEAFGPLERSRVYESQAVGFAGEPFYNLVVGFDTELTPQALVEQLRAIEEAHGRERGPDKFAPRTLDLDLLLYDDLVLKEGRLQLPRDEITRFAFVLRPLAELLPEGRHPVSGESYGELWRAFDATDQPLWPVELEG